MMDKIPEGFSEQESAYYAALKLVRKIDDDLANGTGHYRDRAGKLLRRLDEVVGAILAGELVG